MIQPYCEYCDERHDPLVECEDYDPVYAVETRNMQSAIHELFIFKDKESAESANLIIAQIEDGDFELWSELTEMDYEHFEVNFYLKDAKNRYKLRDGRIVEVINDNCYDLY
jgi:hypothetical protein